MNVGKFNYPKVSVFKKVIDTQPSEHMPLLQALTQIHNNSHYHLTKECARLYAAGDKDGYAEMKRKLPAFTASGTFEPIRKDENLKTYAKFIILDIDKLQPDQVLPLKEQIEQIPLTFCTFISPSRCGLKILCRVSSGPEMHQQAFLQLQKIYKNKLKVEIDPSGKNISRLCFFSGDSSIYINEDAKEYTPTHQQIEIQEQPSPTQSNKDNSYKPIFDKCLALTLNKISFVEGSRNNFVNLLANNCNRNGIPENEAGALIKVQFNYDDAEVSATIKSAYNNSTEFGKYKKPNQQQQQTSKLLSTKGAVPLRDLILRASKEPPVPFVWSGIKKGSFGFIFGPSKSGKTTLCENLAMSLAAGLTKCFGMDIIADSYKVLFLSFEEYWQQRTDRNTIQASILYENLGTDEWLDNYISIDEQVPRLINSEDEWLFIERLITDSKANVVFVDSLSRLYTGGIEDSGLAKQVSLRLRELTNKLKITLIVIHHTPKQTGKPITIDSLAGSRILAQEADFLIAVGKTPDGRRYYKEVAFRYKPENSDMVKLFEIDSHLWLLPTAEMPETEVLKEKDGRTDDTNSEMILEFIVDKTNSPQGETYTSELMNEFVDSKIISKQTLYNCLSKLENQDKVSKKGKGIYKALQ
ncbi:MAG TPA: BT4734/BF3469 family protein [Flavisolibacter sp.]|nr:BT4734/BF3469 family protein [Flavisolibacter sp.]